MKEKTEIVILVIVCLVLVLVALLLFHEDLEIKNKEKMFCDSFKGIYETDRGVCYLDENGILTECKIIEIGGKLYLTR